MADMFTKELIVGNFEHFSNLIHLPKCYMPRGGMVGEVAWLMMMGSIGERLWFYFLVCTYFTLLSTFFFW